MLTHSRHSTLNTERSSFITQETFDEMCETLMEFEKVPHSMRRVKKLFFKYSREGISGNQELFFEEFLNLMKSYEPLPYAVYR